MAKKNSNVPFEFLGEQVQAGERREFALPIGGLYTQTKMDIPIEVIHGRKPGPVLLICAAIHGDELNGIDIVRRVLNSSWLPTLRGTLIAVPIVNVLGCIHRSRYLPDRRDLNRCFPGSAKGSLAARIAYLYLTEVLQKSNYAIDLHTGALHRSNLPQIRVHLQNEKAAEIAYAFGAPIIINAEIRDGSLRGAGDDIGVPIITYEAGEALRFDEAAIVAGVRGIRRVMRHLSMLPAARKAPSRIIEPVLANSSTWIRAPETGFFSSLTPLGHTVKKGDIIGMINGPMNGEGMEIIAPWSGIVIGHCNLPLAYEGEAVFHIARFEKVGVAEEVVENFQELIDANIENATTTPQS